MTLTQLITLWLTLGITGVTIDLSDKKNRQEYKGMNIFHSGVYFMLFVVGGALTLSMAFADYQIRNKNK